MISGSDSRQGLGEAPPWPSWRHQAGNLPPCVVRMAATFGHRKGAKTHAPAQAPLQTDTKRPPGVGYVVIEHHHASPALPLCIRITAASTPAP